MRINNRVLNIEIHGRQDDPTIVMLHHGLGSTQAWRRQVPFFTAAGYRLILYDRWGYGKSDQRPHLDVPCFKDDLLDLKQILASFSNKPMTLIGHSDGGSIALYYAVQNPETLAGLVTVAAHIYLEPKMEPGIQQLKQAFEQDTRLRNGLKRVHGEKYQSTFWNWYTGWHNPAAIQWDMRPMLSNILCPTLVIQGENDEYATPQHAIDIATSIPITELWLIPGAGHMLHQEIDEEFNQRVIVFLEAIKTSVNTHQL